MEELSFKTKLKEVPVTIDEKKYFLRELNGVQREEHNQSLDLDIEFVDGKPKISTKAGFKIPSDFELLSKCLYDESNVLVELTVLKKWPTTMLTKLHKRAMTLSGLDEAAKAKAKNDSEASDSSGTESQTD